MTGAAQREGEKCEKEYGTTQSIQETIEKWERNAEEGERRMNDSFTKLNRQLRGLVGVKTYEQPETEDEEEELSEGEETRKEAESSEQEESSEEEERSEERNEVEDTAREGDAKEAEGSTPSKSVTYASQVAGVGAKSRLWADVESKTEEGAKAGEETEKAGVTKEKGRIKTLETAEKERDRLWQQEMRERKTRTRNVVIRDMEAAEEEKVEDVVEKWLEQELGRRVEIDQIRVDNESLVIVRLKWMKDVREVLERRVAIREDGDIWVDRDRTFRERRNGWIVRERAREERRRGRKVLEEEGRVNIDGSWWRWAEKEEEWVKENKESGWKELSNMTQVEWKKEEVVRWREDLERRRAELIKDEEELKAEEQKVIAMEEEERVTKGKEQEEAVKDKRDEREGRTGTAVQKRKKREAEAVREKETEKTEKVTEKEKNRRTEKGKTACREQENQNTGVKSRAQRKREDLERWRAELERKKEEMREEEEELEKVERRVKEELGAERTGGVSQAIRD